MAQICNLDEMERLLKAAEQLSIILKRIPEQEKYIQELRDKHSMLSYCRPFDETYKQLNRVTILMESAEGVLTNLFLRKSELELFIKTWHDH